VSIRSRLPSPNFESGSTNIGEEPVDPEIVVVNGERPYDVVVGRNILEQAALYVPKSALRVAVFHAPATVASAKVIAQSLEVLGKQILLIKLPDAEAAKNVTVASECWETLGSAGFTRTDAAVAVGGGATTDIGGFVAATWMRGISIVQVPTTLCAIVDAAVGGKTGINTKAGKNLVGSIHPPTAVICDLTMLATLPSADYAAGLAETIKAGFIVDPEILNIAEANPAAVLDPTSSETQEIILRAIQVKADVVAEDLGESIDRTLGRQVLNYGHTFAHAIERTENYTWRHGDAVAVGMVFAAALSVAAGKLSPEAIPRHKELLTSLGLPISYSGAELSVLLEAMAMDKKSRGNTLRFVALDDYGKASILEDPDPAWLDVAYAAVRTP
jgi:3-dehydroquinate synthase